MRCSKGHYLDALGICARCQPEERRRWVRLRIGVYGLRRRWSLFPEWSEWRDTGVWRRA